MIRGGGRFSTGMGQNTSRDNSAEIFTNLGNPFCLRRSAFWLPIKPIGLILKGSGPVRLQAHWFTQVALLPLRLMVRPGTVKPGDDDGQKAQCITPSTKCPK